MTASRGDACRTVNEQEIGGKARKENVGNDIHVTYCLSQHHSADPYDLSNDEDDHGNKDGTKSYRYEQSGLPDRKSTRLNSSH